MIQLNFDDQPVDYATHQLRIHCVEAHMNCPYSNEAVLSMLQRALIDQFAFELHIDHTQLRTNGFTSKNTIRKHLMFLINKQVICSNSSADVGETMLL